MVAISGAALVLEELDLGAATAHLYAGLAVMADAAAARRLQEGWANG